MPKRAHHRGFFHLEVRQAKQSITDSIHHQIQWTEADGELYAMTCNLLDLYAGNISLLSYSFYHHRRHHRIIIITIIIIVIIIIMIIITIIIIIIFILITILVVVVVLTLLLFIFYVIIIAISSMSFETFIPLCFNQSSDRSCTWGMIHNKIHLIRGVLGPV